MKCISIDVVLIVEIRMHETILEKLFLLLNKKHQAAEAKQLPHVCFLRS
jgi:hypothetical protein